MKPQPSLCGKTERFTKIKDITSDMESKDEVISIEINKEQPSKPSDKDKHPYFPE